MAQKQAQITQRSQAELKNVSGHVWYEVWMLWECARLLSLGTPTLGTVLNNAILESFTIHQRSLYHFLYPDRPRPDDVLAKHFFKSVGEWENQRPPPGLQDIMTRTGKEIAHITYARLDVKPEAKSWTVGMQADALIEQVQIWAQSVEPDLLSNEWTEGRLPLARRAGESAQ